MTTTEQVQNVLKAKHQELVRDASFQKLQEFYRKKSEEGAVIKRDYALPQLDTIGREVYHLLAPGKTSA